MKLQIAACVLGEGQYLQFTLKIHADVLDDVLDRDVGVRDYLRDRIKRCLRDVCGTAKHCFYFVLEDRDKVGSDVAVHAHGAIEILPLGYQSKARGNLGLRRRVARNEMTDVEARYLAGAMRIKAAFEKAVGLLRNPQVAVINGVDQSRNVWFGHPRFPMSNHHWVSYACKNSLRQGREFGEERVAVSRELSGLAQELWEVIRSGEAGVAKARKSAQRFRALKV